MTIFLCGFMGCGKSTVGVRLAKKMDCPFTDMDTYIEEQAGMSIPEIFEIHGEPHFRDLETQAVRELSEREGVIACGGGAMLREMNAKIARENGIVLFLDVPFVTCFRRIANTDRPIVRRSSRQELYELYQKRRKTYKHHSTYSINASGSPSSVVQSIIILLVDKHVIQTEFVGKLNEVTQSVTPMINSASSTEWSIKRNTKNAGKADATSPAKILSIKIKDKNAVAALSSELWSTQIKAKKTGNVAAASSKIKNIEILNKKTKHGN